MYEMLYLVHAVCIYVVNAYLGPISKNFMEKSSPKVCHL